MQNFIEFSENRIYYQKRSEEKSPGNMAYQKKRKKHVRIRYYEHMKRINKYNKLVYDRIGITIHKTDKYNKSYIQEYCKLHGISVNAFIISCINNTLDTVNNNTDLLE